MQLKKWLWKELYFDGVDLNEFCLQGMNRYIQPDVEYGNSIGFYSASKAKDLPYSALVSKPSGFIWNGALEKTSISIKDSFFLNKTKLDRKLEFSLNEESLLFDFVSRFVVISKNERPAEIAGQKVEHKSSNIYRQYSACHSAIVPVGNDLLLEFSSIGAEIPPGFDEVFYIRDESQRAGIYRWIVHHRLIVNPLKANLILRCCNPRFEGVVPWQKFIPGQLKRQLFRIREKALPSFPFMVVGEVSVSAGADVKLHTKVEII
ncbi:MAG: hypothetical protein D6B27_07620 [Gammaproteobacteria bacterium]|nr:MAG: hypothetical protein D6B27_07620 [Gammaproteobacteria bacterium]